MLTKQSEQLSIYTTPYTILTLTQPTAWKLLEMPVRNGLLIQVTCNISVGVGVFF